MGRTAAEGGRVLPPPSIPPESMHADGLELLAPGIGYRRLTAVGQHDRRAVGCMQGVEQGTRRQLRRLRKLPLHVLGADRPHVGDLAAAEQRQRLGRDHRLSGDVVGQIVVHVAVHGTRLLSIQRVEPCACSITIADADRPHDPFRLRPGEIDGQQPVLQVRAEHLHAFRQHEGALELACGDAAMEVLAGLVVLLPTADDELVFLDRHIELIAGEACDRQRYPQPLRLAVVTGDPLDVVGRIAVGGLGNAIERSLDLVKPEQEGAGQRRNTRHGLKALVSDFDGALAAPPRPSGGRASPAGQSATIWALPVKCSRTLAKCGIGRARRTPRSA